MINIGENNDKKDIKSINQISSKEKIKELNNKIALLVKGIKEEREKNKNILKEIQDKMNHLSEENKKMKIKKTKVYNNRIKEIKNNYRANNTFSLDINKEDFTEKKLDKTTIANGNNLTEINNDNNISDINVNISTNLNTTTKKMKKKVKVVKKFMRENLKMEK